MSAPLLDVKAVSKRFQAPRRSLFGPPDALTAVDDVSFTLAAGETLGIVGESGCGKSTLGRMILRLIDPSSGDIRFDGQSLTALTAEEMRLRRRDLQIIFQDPIASLDPRMTVGAIIAEPLRSFEPDLDSAARRARVLETMEAVGLLPEMLNRFPHEFSGGQAQRIGIARAIVSRPKLIVCDEPVSALDVSIQAQIIRLLDDLKQRYNLTLIFISHDLSVVRLISDRLLVLYLGRVVESGPVSALFNTPRHPYTQALLSAVPMLDPAQARRRQRILLKGDPPSPINPPSGCVFRTRCPIAAPDCAAIRPALSTISPGHDAACLKAETAQNIPAVE